MVDDNDTKIDYSEVFLRYMLTLQSGAKIALGEIKDPSSDKFTTNYKEAREIINILGMISQKTKGNLNKYESDILDNILSSLRFSYVKTLNSDENDE